MLKFLGLNLKPSENDLPVRAASACSCSPTELPCLKTLAILAIGAVPATTCYADMLSELTLKI